MIVIFKMICIGPHYTRLVFKETAKKSPN